MLEKPIIGWREWVALPQLRIRKLSAKIDTGAKTSSLHAEAIQVFYKQGKKRVSFVLHQRHRKKERSVQCVATVIDERVVTDSGGHRERRYVIKTPIVLGTTRWPVEITLTDRASMRFPMLIGRGSLRGLFVVDPVHTYQLGLPQVKKAVRQ